jgi:hypothetical protein
MMIYVALVVIVYGWLLVKGVRRRRNTWSAESWRRYAFALILSLVVFAGGIRLAYALDDGLVSEMTSSRGQLMNLGLGALAVFSHLPILSLLGWLANGEPKHKPWWPSASRDHSPNTR